MKNEKEERMRRMKMEIETNERKARNPCATRRPSQMALAPAHLP